MISTPHDSLRVRIFKLRLGQAGPQLIKTFTFSGYQWFVAPTGITILGPTTLSSDNVVYPDAKKAMTIKFAKIGNNWQALRSV
jgi:hypothetical protein